MKTTYHFKIEELEDKDMWNGSNIETYKQDLRNGRCERSVMLDKGIMLRRVKLLISNYHRLTDEEKKEKEYLKYKLGLATPGKVVNSNQEE